MAITHSHSDLAGIGIYTVTEAARYTRVPAQRIRNWVCGYSHGKEGRKRFSAPVWSRAIPEIDGEVAVSFLDLIEVRFVDAFRRKGVPLRAIRRAQKEAKKMFGNSHPFATKRWETDGQVVLLQVQRTPDGDEELLDVASKQWEFNKLVQPYLKGVEFDEEQAVRWRPAGPGTPIVLDPKRRSGQPIVDEYNIPTSILSNAVRAEGDEEAVSEWYEIPLHLVHAAVEFEQQYPS